MKTIEASVLNKEAFEIFSATKEPLIIGDNDNPLGVFFPIKYLEEFFNLEDEEIKSKISSYIVTGKGLK